MRLKEELKGADVGKVQHGRRLIDQFCQVVGVSPESILVGTELVVLYTCVLNECR